MVTGKPQGNCHVQERDVTHGVAKVEAVVTVHVSELVAQLLHFLIAGDLVQAHAPAEVLDTGNSKVQPSCHEGALLALVLPAGLEIDQFRAKLNYRTVILEKLGKVEGAPTFVALLIKVDGSYAVLVLVEVRANLDNIVIGTHVTEQSYKTALVEFYKLLCQSYGVKVGPGEVIPDEIVSR